MADRLKTVGAAAGRCPRCGYEIMEGDRCPECGNVGTRLRYSPTEVRLIVGAQRLARHSMLLFWSGIAAFLLFPFISLGLSRIGVAESRLVLWGIVGVFPVVLALLSLAFWMISESVPTRSTVFWWGMRTSLISGPAAIGLWWVLLANGPENVLLWLALYACVGVAGVHLYAIVVFSRKLSGVVTTNGVGGTLVQIVALAMSIAVVIIASTLSRSIAIVAYALLVFVWILAVASFAWSSAIGCQSLSQGGQRRAE